MRTLAAVAVLALAALPVASLAQSAPSASSAAQADAPATLTVTGEGKVERAPDRATVTVSIVTNDDVAATSSAKNTQIYNALRAKLTPLGLGDDAVRTTFFNVDYIPHPPKNLPPDQRQPRYGFVTSRTLEVVCAVDAAGKVIDAATSVPGATQAGQVSFDLKDRRAAYDAALAEAMGDAKRQADAVAAAGGVSLGRVLGIQVGYATPVQPPRPFMMRMTADAAAPAPPTELGNGGPISVSAQVTVTYTLR